MATQNLIQIKRSETTDAPASLANGELAWSGNGDVLFIGNFGSVLAVAGARNPGTLTANQAIVVDSNSKINNIIATDITLENQLTANGSTGSAGQVLYSGGAAANAYWADSAAGSLDGLSDTNITTPADGSLLFYDTGTSKWIDNAMSGDATIADTGVLTLASTTVVSGSYGDANSVATFTVDAKGRLTAAGTADIDHDTLLNFVSNEHIDHSTVSITAGSGLTGGGTIAATRTINVGAGNGVTVGADSVGVLANNGIIANTTGVFVDGANGISVDASGVNVLTGNNQIVSNTTGIWIASITAAQISDDIALGTDTSGNYVATITAGNGITGSATGEGSSPTIAVDGANGISVDASGVNVLAGNNDITVNSTGVWITSIALGTQTSGNYVATISGTTNEIEVSGSGSETAAVTIGLPNDVTITNDLSVGNDLTVTGNLIVSGTTTTLNTTQLIVEDNLIGLASNNAGDAVDFGFYGQYDDSGIKYAGLYRDASDGTGVFKLFDGLGTEPTGTTVGGGSLAALDVGALDASSITTTGTAAIGTLTLTTDLAVTHGGTGASSFTDNGIIYGNGTSALSVTAAGTQYQVLQAGSGGVPEWGSLDGGTF